MIRTGWRGSRGPRVNWAPHCSGQLSSKRVSKPPEPSSAGPSPVPRRYRSRRGRWPPQGLTLLWGRVVQCPFGTSLLLRSCSFPPRPRDAQRATKGKEIGFAATSTTHYRDRVRAVLALLSLIFGFVLVLVVIASKSPSFIDFLFVILFGILAICINLIFAYGSNASPRSASQRIERACEADFLSLCSSLRNPWEERKK